MVSIRVALTVIVLVTLISSSPNAAPDFSNWSAPVNLGPTINSTFAEAGPAISKDGLSLYFHSERPGGEGSTDFWVSQRASEDAQWEAPVHLGDVINTPFTEAVAALSRDEHWLFFTSDRPGGGGSDIWMSYRQHTHDPFDWQPAVNLGAGVNSAFLESAPSYFANDDGGAPQLFFHSARPGGLGGTDIYVSELFPNGTWGPSSLVVELSSPANEQHPSIRFDGLEVFFFSPRPGSLGGPDLWAATRRTVSDLWSTPTNLGPIVNSALAEVQPYIASDRRTLYFQSDRPGGSGSQDIWMSTRSKH